MNAISRKRLYQFLEFKKIPKDLITTYTNIPLMDSEGVILIYTDISIRKSSENRKHRIFAYCPNCGEWLPTGRFHQHYGSKKCKEAND